MRDHVRRGTDPDGQLHVSVAGRGRPHGRVPAARGLLGWRGGEVVGVVFGRLGRLGGQLGHGGGRECDVGGRECDGALGCDGFPPGWKGLFSSQDGRTRGRVTRTTSEKSVFGFHLAKSSSANAERGKRKKTPFPLLLAY